MRGWVTRLPDTKNIRAGGGGDRVTSVALRLRLPIDGAMSWSWWVEGAVGMDMFVSELIRRQLDMVRHVKICRPHALACTWRCGGEAVPE